ncbi:uncharacterized protein LACBIDRAFT_301915 [Laccaria bicolor S238N-H82]|uniref:Predicted protein n=1 Tax=Laccaria bicolor (strain S238N-H82 / ATCC MYA-4686) TaxID=486041 RepID=B0CPW9_LACBS|nr:uncharacterized protein LACBIDRAFT_301915 [Laccaria bicolor S238N-H82]EDR15486.1 predicted protein [Laccaria bicolor S238N-H82]|eukprot:XP_001873694.1 predicted protein [Laccaria bicolor S238N-H82]
MAEPKPITAPATAASGGDHLFLWLDDDHPPPEGGHHHHHDPHERAILTFFGTYTTPAQSGDEGTLEAKGTLTFESTEKFAAGDHGKFRVSKKKGCAEYDVEVGITYLKKDGLRAIDMSALVSSFKGKGNLREGGGIGEWKWMTRNEK